jgi:16S rRNA (guanine966-N2)-methyltransferase
VPEAGRVITGRAGGLRLLAPGEGTRPLSDKVKQALFSLLEAACPEAWEGPFLDLFAGSGAAGIEALSRGAPGAVFVERDAAAMRTVSENLRRTRLEGASLVRRDALSWLAAGAAAAGRHPFSVALVDPPYDRPDLASGALERLGDPGLGWLRDDGCVVVKHFWRDEPPATTGRLVRVRARRFGETALSLYRVSIPGATGIAGAEAPAGPDEDGGDR